MKNLFLLIVLAAAGYLGFLAYKGELPASLQQFWPKSQTAPASGPAAAQPPEGAPVAPAAPDFVSKVEIPGNLPPGEKRLAPLGVYYIVERVSAETETGVHAVVPGDKVNLMKRNADGTMMVTDGEVKFTLKGAQLTNDLDVAKAAEAKDRSVFRGKR